MLENRLTVLEVASLFGEYTEIWVCESDTGDKIGHYDGRDSIPEECNDLIVESIEVVWPMQQVVIMV